MDKHEMIKEVAVRDKNDPEILQLLELSGSKYEVRWEAYVKSKI